MRTHTRARAHTHTHTHTQDKKWVPHTSMITMDSSQPNSTRIVHAIGRLDLYQSHEYALKMKQTLDALKTKQTLDPLHHPTPIDCAAGSGGKGAAGKPSQDCPAPHAVPIRTHAPREKERGLPGFVSSYAIPALFVLLNSI
jgi:hypothetical protein